jgi:hypothetical protein
MIGSMSVTIEILPQTGSRVDATARVIGPGDTDYKIPISVTKTIQAVWGIADSQLEAALAALIKDVMGITGTASEPPVGGYWFDSYNSESTVRETLNRIRNLGQAAFLKNPSTRNQISDIFGGAILTELERIDSIFFANANMRLTKPLDYSFERSQAEQDLGSPPTDNAGLLYRICILSVLIDAFAVRRSGENPNTPSLKALTNWVATQRSVPDARLVTEPFAKVKDLRKQYPIHEHFVAGTAGQKTIRDEVIAAETFFGFKPHYDDATKWKAVTDAFKSGLSELEALVATSRS